MLARDVDNMRRYFGQFAPALLRTNYANEIWELYEEGKLTPDVELTGIYHANTEAADVDGVMEQIQEAYREEQMRLERLKEDKEGA